MREAVAGDFGLNERYCSHVWWPLTGCRRCMGVKSWLCMECKATRHANGCFCTEA